jgi:hypothetical protein
MPNFIFYFFNLTERLLFSLHISNAICFTATEFDPSLVTTFILEYAQLMLAKKKEVQDSLPRLLPSAFRVGRHTDIVHIRSEEGDTTYGSRYIWVRQQIRPWGRPLPVQCAKCGWIRPWLPCKTEGEMNKVDKTDFDVGFACKNPLCDYTLTYAAVVDPKWVTDEVFGGCWMSVKEIAT